MTPLVFGTVSSVLLIMLSACAPIKPPNDSTNNNNNGNNANNGNTDNTNNTNPVNPTNIKVDIISVGLVGAGTPNKAEVDVDAFFGDVTYKVTNIPAGLKVKAEPPQDNAGSTRLVLKLDGTPQDKQAIRLSISVRDQTTTLEVPIMAFRSQEITHKTLKSKYISQQILLLGNNRALLSSESNLGNDSQCCKQILYKTSRQESPFKALPLPVKTPYDWIRFMTIQGDTKQFWVVIKGTGTSELMSYDQPDFSNQNALQKPNKHIKVPNSVINELVWAKQKLWYIPYNKSSLVSVDPVTGQQKTHTLPQNSTNGTYRSLVAGADHLLYALQKGHIVQIDPNTQKTRVFPFTMSGKEPQAFALTAAPDGHLWYIGALSTRLWKLNPKTGVHSKQNLPKGAQPSKIAIGQGGHVWVSDNSSKRLYTLYKGEFIGVDSLKPNNKTNTLNALAVDASGKIWYEQAGHLVQQY